MMKETGLNLAKRRSAAIIYGFVAMKTNLSLSYCLLMKKVACHDAEARWKVNVVCPSKTYTPYNNRALHDRTNETNPYVMLNELGNMNTPPSL